MVAGNLFIADKAVRECVLNQIFPSEGCGYREMLTSFVKSWFSTECYTEAMMLVTANEVSVFTALQSKAFIKVAHEVV